MQRISGNHTTISGKIIDFDFEIASHWSELDPHQAASAIEVLSYSKADRFVIAASLLALLFQKHWDIISVLPEEDLHSLIPCTNFLIEEAPPLKNFFPELNIRKKKCFAPSDSLGNIGFGEWCFAFQFYTYYQKTKDISWLNKLIAAIYRPSDPNQNANDINYKGDIREVFNENLIDKRAIAVQGIPYKFKLAILAWFSIAVNQIMQQRPNVFPALPEHQEEEHQEDQNDSRTWLSVFRELLGPKWGTVEQLKFTNAIFILDALEEQKIEYNATIKAANR